jgi:hypothetical protein
MNIKQFTALRLQRRANKAPSIVRLLWSYAKIKDGQSNEVKYQNIPMAQDV